MGDPVGLALVDLGVVRTVRGLRAAVGVVREAAGEVQLARVGPRQLGILAGGLQTSQVTRMAALVQARLEGAGYHGDRPQHARRSRAAGRDVGPGRARPGAGPSGRRPLISTAGRRRSAGQVLRTTGSSARSTISETTVSVVAAGSDT